MKSEMNQTYREVRSEFPAFDQGEIKYIERDADYGVIENIDGKHVYFDCACVIGVDFYRLQVGDRVVYSARNDSRLRQATSVYLAGSHAFQEW